MNADSDKHSTEDRGSITAVVRLLLLDAELIAFQYDSGFTVHFQHPLPQANTTWPVTSSLVLRSRWWPGVDKGIPVGLTATDQEGISCRPEQPYQAFRLMGFVGQKVEHVEIASDSSLSILLSGGHLICVPGKEAEWDFSWYLFVPSDFPGADTWSISCDNVGNLYGTWPADAKLL